MVTQQDEDHSSIHPTPKALNLWLVWFAFLQAGLCLPGGGGQCLMNKKETAQRRTLGTQGALRTTPKPGHRPLGVEPGFPKIFLKVCKMLHT